MCRCPRAWFTTTTCSACRCSIPAARGLGSLTAVEEGVRGYHYVVTGGEKSYRIPAVDEFVKSVSLEDGVVVALIDGLEL